jgi:hypothetical protein
MEMTMVTKQVTITVDEELLAWFEQKAAQTGSKLSPTIARAARNWMLWEDAARLAEADQRSDRNTADHAEAELAAQREAEAAEAGRGHVAGGKGRSGSSNATVRPGKMIPARLTALSSVPTIGCRLSVDGSSLPPSCPPWMSTPRSRYGSSPVTPSRDLFARTR